MFTVTHTLYKFKLVHLLKKHDIIRYGNYILKSGQNSSIYFDFRSVYSHPNLLREITSFIVDNIEEFLRKEFPHCFPMIAGVPLGAIPIATSVGIDMKLPVLLIRESQKTYGLQNIIEGKIVSKDIILIEDVVTTGASVKNTLDVLKKAGLHVRLLIVILSRNDKSVLWLQEEMNRTQEHCSIRVLFRLDDFSEDDSRHHIQSKL